MVGQDEMMLLTDLFGVKMTEADRKRLIVKYTEGDCGVLALALHERIGFSLVGTRYKWSVKNHHLSYDHYGIKQDDSFWDIRGRITENEFVELIKSQPENPRCFDIVDAALILRAYQRISSREKETAIKNYLRMHTMLPGEIADQIIPDPQKELAIRTLFL